MSKKYLEESLEAIDRIQLSAPLNIPGKNWLISDYGLDDDTPGLFYFEPKFLVGSVFGMGFLRLGKDPLVGPVINSFRFVKPDKMMMRRSGGYAFNPAMVFAATITSRGCEKPVPLLYSSGPGVLAPANEYSRSIAKSGLHKTIVNGAKMLSGTNFLFDSQFHCTFNYSGISIASFLDPYDICKIFKDRESAIGERKKALLHIVGSHIRRTPTRDQFLEIRSYLRGSAKCVWHGMEVSLFGPRVDDYEALMRLVAEAEAKLGGEPCTQ